jgi:hypothetical protein
MLFGMASQNQFGSPNDASKEAGLFITSAITTTSISISIFAIVLYDRF